MTTKFAFSRHLGLRFCGWLAALAFATTALMAQAPAARIRSEISSSYTTPLKVAQHPWVQAQYDAGRMPGDSKLSAMTLVFNRTPAQQAALEALIAAQQDPASPQYHQWLTPEQFGARFGMASSDLAKVQTWLQQQGFTIDAVARSKTFIQFTGSVAQFEFAFQTQMHYYQVQGNKHFAPSSELAIPTALASTVETIRGVSDFKPHSFHRPARLAKPSFTSSISGSVFFTPGDIKTTYDVNSLLNTGDTGSGQSIAIMGQSQVDVTDVENFQSAAGLPKKDPTMVYVPNTGVPAFNSGDEGESDLDLEWSGAMAPGANIYFVYTGNGSNSNGVFDSIQYAIDQKIGDIISVSYGACETALGTFTQESLYQQATSQGQTIIAASGDQGSTACFGDTNLTTVQQEALVVNYPASSPSVTGVGGTEISTADDVSTNSTYWTGQGSSDVISSAKTWIPEISWNDDAANVAAGCTGNCLSASGGGASTLFPKPTWQAGVPGIPSDSHRDVPDIAFYSSPGLPGYLYCTSDQSDWGSKQSGSCGSGFRASSTDTSLTVAGGTSFAAPIFAGMLAVLNQKGGYVGGQGLFNTELYKLASNSGTYAAAFHDVTSGNNDCLAGTTECSGQIGFNAGTGYDQVTGLGSIDVGVFATALPAFTGTPLINTAVSVSATPSTPAVNANDTITITVASVGSSSVPTGNLAITVDSGSPTTAALSPGSGSYTFTTKFTAAGVHTIAVQYQGDSTHETSSGAVTVTIPLGTLAATNITVTSGKSQTTTLTLTPQNGYTGTVDYTLTTTSSTLANTNTICYSPLNPTATVSGTSAVTTTLTFYTNSSNCNSSTGGAQKGGTRAILRYSPIGKAASTTPASRANPVQRASLGFIALLLAAFIGWRFRSLRALAGLVMIAALGFTMTACGGGSSSGGGGGGTTGTNAPTGTYQLYVTATDSTSGTSAAVTTGFTLTIQ